MVHFNQILALSINQKPIFIFLFESDGFGRLNLDGLESKVLTIRFGRPNCLSLTQSVNAGLRCELDHSKQVFNKFISFEMVQL